MGLIAWYPLNGDTKDYSGNGNDADNAGAKITSEGKIGQAYSFENDTSGINIRNQNFDHLREYSMSAWVKPKGNHRNYNGAIISSGNWNNQAWSFGLSQNNMSIDVASNRYNVYVDYKVPLNEWTHITSTMKDNIAKVYVNGEFIAQRSATAQLQSNASNTFIGRETYAGGYFSFNGDLNDIRVYDHALSEKEISEIAKAKILHYTFDDPYSEPTENLWKGSMIIYNNYGVPASLVKTGEKYQGQDVHRLTMTVNDAKAGSLGNFQTSLGGHGIYGGRMTFKASTKYVASIYWKPISHSDTVFGGVASNIGGWIAGENEIMNGNWKRFHATRSGGVTTDKTDNVFFSYASKSLELNESFIVDIVAPQIEEGKNNPTPFTTNKREGLFKDISGYKNHGTTSLLKAPQWTDESKVGVGGLVFDNSDLYHPNPFLGQGPKEQEWTVSAWIKPEGVGRPQINNFNTYNGVGVGGTASLLYLNGGVNDYYTYGGTYPSEEWSLLAYVFRNSDGLRKIYRNGVDISTSGPNLTSTPRGISDVVKMGSNFKGLISDYRIYATALSDADIKELYQSRANVDDMGNLATSNIKESKNIFIPNYFFETSSVSIEQSTELHDGRKTWSVSPHWFHPQGALENRFEENTSYSIKLTFKHQTEHNNNYVTGGFVVRFKDGSSHNLITRGNTGWNTLRYTSPKNKSIEKIAVHYFSSYEVYIDSSSYIRKNQLSLEDSGTFKVEDINEVGLPIRYIRERMNGSNKNTGNHWVEVEAYDSNDTNVARGAGTNHSYHTDGNTNSSPYTSVAPLIDLGEVKTIIYLKMYHYYADARIYNDIVTEVSADGVNWKVVFDSSVDGQYVETKDGNKIYLYPDKMSISDKGELFVRELKEVVY